MPLIEGVISGVVILFTLAFLIWLLRSWRQHNLHMSKMDRAIHLISCIDWRDLPPEVPLKVMHAIRGQDYEMVIRILSPYEPTWE